MKIVQEDFRVSTKSRNQMIDITSQVGSLVGQAGVTDGDVIVYCPHTTAAITINENADPSVPHDRATGIPRAIPIRIVKAHSSAAANRFSLRAGRYSLARGRAFFSVNSTAPAAGK